MSEPTMDPEFVRLVQEVRDATTSLNAAWSNETDGDSFSVRRREAAQERFVESQRALHRWHREQRAEAIQQAAHAIDGMLCDENRVEVRDALTMARRLVYEVLVPEPVAKGAPNATA